MAATVGVLPSKLTARLGPSLSATVRIVGPRALLWFVPASSFHLQTPASDPGTYRFNKHEIAHHFCTVCGVAPFAEGEKDGQKLAAMNVRCLAGIELADLAIRHVDGRSL